MVGVKHKEDVTKSVKIVSDGVKKIVQVTENQKVKEVTGGVSGVKEAEEMSMRYEKEGGGSQEDPLGAHGGVGQGVVRGNMIMVLT